MKIFSNENILVYNILYKSLIDCKPLCIRFIKSHGFNRIYDRTRYLVLFGSAKYFICNKIRYLISVKSGVTYIISHSYAKIKLYSQYYKYLLSQFGIKIKITTAMFIFKKSFIRIT